MRSIGGKPFDRSDRGIDRRDLRLASPSGLPADLDGAGATLADATSELRSLHVENVSENPEKGHVSRYVYRLRLPIHSQFVGHINLLGEKAECSAVEKRITVEGTRSMVYEVIWTPRQKATYPLISFAASFGAG